MASRIRPVTRESTDDAELRQLLTDGAEGWWKDAEMFGVIGRVPDLLKSIVPVFASFFGGGRVEPHLFEMMRIKTGQMNDCAYWTTVRTAAVRGEVEPKEKVVLSGDYRSLPRREALGVELAERMAMDPHAVTDGFWAELRAEFTDEEIVELAFACSIFNWGNKFNITMRLDTEGEEYERGMEYEDAPTFWRRGEGPEASGG